MDECDCIVLVSDEVFEEAPLGLLLLKEEFENEEVDVELGAIDNVIT